MVIDADYRGPVIVALHNDTNEHQIVLAGSRIAQLIVMPYVNSEFIEVRALDQTKRGNGGFGSTGTN